MKQLVRLRFLVLGRAAREEGAALMSWWGTAAGSAGSGERRMRKRAFQGLLVVILLMSRGGMVDVVVYDGNRKRGGNHHLVVYWCSTAVSLHRFCHIHINIGAVEAVFVNGKSFGFAIKAPVMVNDPLLVFVVLCNGF